MWTADHCITSQAVASTLNTYLFFWRERAATRRSPPFVQLGDGRHDAGRSQDKDWVFVRLERAAAARGRASPHGAAEPLASGRQVVSLHPPFRRSPQDSRGARDAPSPWSTTASSRERAHLHRSRVVRRASPRTARSGGALATLAPGGSLLRDSRRPLRRALGVHGDPTAATYYSHLEEALPLMRQYFTPMADNRKARSPRSSSTTGARPLFPVDQPGRDRQPRQRPHGRLGAHGTAFPRVRRPAAGNEPGVPVLPGAGSSATRISIPRQSRGMRRQTAAAHPVDWIYESPNVFYVQLPDTTTGACPAGTVARVPFLQHGVTTNHRYTTEQAIRDEMRAFRSAGRPRATGPGRTTRSCARGRRAEERAGTRSRSDTRRRPARRPQAIHLRPRRRSRSSPNVTPSSVSSMRIVDRAWAAARCRRARSPGRSS